MFYGSRYLTRRITQELSLDMQIILWNLIDQINAAREFPIDYLQVFDLETATIGSFSGQKVTHRQENPDYCKTHFFRSDNPIKAKIFVIDDGPYATMLFADEY